MKRSKKTVMLTSLRYLITLAIALQSCVTFAQEGRQPLSWVTLERPQTTGPTPVEPNQSSAPTMLTSLQRPIPASSVTLGRPIADIASTPGAAQPIVTLGPPRAPLQLTSSSRTQDAESLPAPAPQSDANPLTAIWQDQVLIPQISAEQSLSISLDALVPAALQQSKRIAIARLQSFVEIEKITQADANFDWTVFTKNIWTDTDEPTGSDLDAGAGTKRRLEENLGFDIGGRRTNRVGGQFEAGQNLALNHTNSTFFNPQDRGIAKLTMRYTQPLLRDGGRLVNEGQVVLAQLQAEASNAAYQTEINDVLQRVVQAYWELYRSRADYCIRKALVSDTQELLKELDRRRRIDAQPALIAQVESQLKGQLADLGAALVKIQRAQYELVRQVGDRNLDAPLELIPLEIPLAEPIQLDLNAVFSTAIQNRGELRTSLKKIQSSQVSKNIAQNQLLPRLAMILETSASGINGDYKFMESFGDQFSQRAPTYSVGFTYEYPIGNRASQSRARQAGITLAREITTFEDTIDQIRKEVRESVASLQGYVGQAQNRKKAVELADTEVKALLERRLKFPAEFDQVSQLYIRTYLDALQRRAQAEQALVSAHVEYSLSLVQLRRALGILVSVGPN